MSSLKRVRSCVVAIGIVCGVAAAPFQLLTLDGSLSPAFIATPDRLRPTVYEFHWQSFAAAATGMACGTAWGLLHSLAGREESGRRRAAAQRAWPISMALVGLFLGWQAATSIALATCLFHAAAWLLGLVWPITRRTPATAYVLAASLVHVVTWRWNDQLPIWPGHATSLVVLGCVCVAGAAAALMPALGGRTGLSSSLKPG